MEGFLILLLYCWRLKSSWESGVCDHACLICCFHGSQMLHLSLQHTSMLSFYLTKVSSWSCNSLIWSYWHWCFLADQPTRPPSSGIFLGIVAFHVLHPWRRVRQRPIRGWLLVRGWLGMTGDDWPGQGLKSQIAAAKRELEEKTTLTQQLDSELQKAGRACRSCCGGAM